ncbi:MAG: FGGY family carbohydrate kinase [Erysipelotrichaceae bacterium]|nr:FGGY family carbohydrate kinase [Erysipelotrichaceae bacterium]
MKYYLAIDIGASSGRHIIGYKEGNEIKTLEVYRFSNGVKELDGHLTWDIDEIERQVKIGIDIAMKQYMIESLSIDTWGIDYVLLNGDEVIYPVYSYRDNRTEGIIDEVHSIVSFEELYKCTGSQFQRFNTIYQLYYDLKNKRLDTVTDFLMIPEYLLYRLTGNKDKEFTDATTTSLINVDTLEFDEEIIDKLKLPKRLFKKISQPKKVIGEYKGIKVVFCATHDTGSAVEGIPMVGNEPYISSGTWSLLGIKTDKPIVSDESMRVNYSNEGGVNYNRYQKNIMGLWVVNELQKELCPELSVVDITKLADESNYEETVDVNLDDFISPKSMKKAFDDHLENKPTSNGDYFRCAYKSLAICYAEAIEELEVNTNKKYRDLYIVGGGAKNYLLNELTKKYTKKNVIALPIEATSLGNLKIQMEVE